MMEEKRQLVEENLLADAEIKITQQMIEMGVDPMGEEAKEQLSPERLKS